MSGVVGEVGDSTKLEATMAMIAIFQNRHHQELNSMRHI